MYFICTGAPYMVGVSAWHERNEKWKTIVKGILRKIFRRIAFESGPTVHLGDGPMTVRKNYPTIRLGW